MFKTDHNIFLRKLYNDGIRANVYEWSIKFWPHTTWSVEVNGETCVTVGVMNVDSFCPEHCRSAFFIYGKCSEQKLSTFISLTDDTRVLAIVKDPKAVEKVQADLNKNMKLSVQNNMQFYESKFELLR